MMPMASIAGPHYAARTQFLCRTTNGTICSGIDFDTWRGRVLEHCSAHFFDFNPEDFWSPVRRAEDVFRDCFTRPGGYWSKSISARWQPYPYPCKTEENDDQLSVRSVSCIPYGSELADRTRKSRRSFTFFHGTETDC
jgi:hypothetical protein